MTRNHKRAVVAITLILGVALFVWQWEARAVETDVAIILVDLAVPGPTGILRYADVAQVAVTVFDDQDQSVAQVTARGGTAVLSPPPISLPRGDYRAAVEITFNPRGTAPVYHRIERPLRLDGTPAEIRF